MKPTNLNKLTRLADQLDDEGRYDAADKVDQALTETSDIYLMPGGGLDEGAWGPIDNEREAQWLCALADFLGRDLKQMEKDQAKEISTKMGTASDLKEYLISTALDELEMLPKEIATGNMLVNDPTHLEFQMRMIANYVAMILTGDEAPSRNDLTNALAKRAVDPEQIAALLKLYEGARRAIGSTSRMIKSAAGEKTVYIVHGWGGHAEESWFPWLEQQVEEAGHKVERLSMPNTDEPDIVEWVNHLRAEIADPDENTYLVGHSIGCQTILRYLETIDTKIGGVVLVAPFFNLPYLETEEEKKIAKPWLETPIDTDKAALNAGKVIAIFSDDDPDVPLTDLQLFEDRLSAKTIVEKNKGHFTLEDVGKELPVVRDQLLGMLK